MRFMAHFRVILSAGIACGLLAALDPTTRAAQAADYPNRAIRIVVPYAAGGVTDAMARLVAGKMSEGIKQPVLVENRVGAGGVIGAEYVIRAAPDGYTLLFATVTVTVYPSFNKDFAYDVRKDLTPITITSTAPYVIMVSKASPFKSLADLIAYAKANPNKLNYGSPGYGTSTHLAAEYFFAAAGIKVVHVPYRGSALTLPALMANEVQMTFDTYIGVAGPVEAGQVRPLAITSLQRAGFNPSIPTADEAGLKDFKVDTWFGFFAPPETPPDIVKRLHKELTVVLKDPQVVANFTTQGQIVANTPEEFAQVITEDVAKWAKIISDAGIKPQ